MKKYKLNELVQATGQVQEIGEATTSPTAVVPTTTEQPVGGAFKKIENDQVVIDMDIIRKSNIFFATPCYGGQITDQYFLSVFRLTQELIKYNINFRITTLRNESLVPRARNILNAMFLEAKECTHLMFIDADIEFEPESVIRMLAMDKDLITGAYPKKTLPVDYAINLKFADKEKTQVKANNK